MKALFVFADGRVKELEVSGADEVHFGVEWFEKAGVAHDENTLVDGMLREGASGPPNNGRVVYVQVR